MTSSKKKIMVISDSSKREKAKQLKLELEKRQVCDVVDIYTANPKKLLEDLIVNKGKEGFVDYRLFIIDEWVDSPDFSLSRHLEHNFPTAHFLLWVRWQKPKTPDDIRSNRFHYNYKRGMTIEQVVEEHKKDWKKTWHMTEERFQKEIEAKERYKEDIREFERALNIERFNYHRNYIMEHKRGQLHYGTVARKIKEILVTGFFDGSPYKKKYYPSPEAERKEKSKKAFEYITAGHGGGIHYTASHRRVLTPLIPVSNEEVLKRFKTYGYGKDITEYEHASDILKRLRSLRQDRKRELEDVDKTIRELEDKFPKLVEDPSTFEVHGEGEEGKEK